jgi:chromate transport protein ChrA
LLWLLYLYLPLVFIYYTAFENVREFQSLAFGLSALYYALLLYLTYRLAKISESTLSVVRIEW